MTQPLRKRMVAARYHEFAHGREAADFAYTPFHWKGEYRFIAVRRSAALEPEDIQRWLFTFKRYTYHRVLELAFQFLCLPPEVRHWNISTLRRELRWVPAEWVKRAKRHYLRLPARYPHQELFGKIQKAIARVRPLT